MKLLGLKLQMQLQTVFSQNQIILDTLLWIAALF